MKKRPCLLPYLRLQVNIIRINLKKGQKKALALKNAKLEYLKRHKGTKLAEPFYWAGFVLYGKNDAVVKTTYLTPWVWTLLILVLALSVALFSKKRFVK